MKKIVPIIIAILAIASISVYSVNKIELVQYKSETKNELAKIYMDAILNSDNSTMWKYTIYSTLPGHATNETNDNEIEMSEAEKSGVLHKKVEAERKVSYYKQIAQQQKALILNEFGPHAFENVSYNYVEIPTTEGKLVNINRLTGKEISQTEYYRLVKEFWEEVAAKEGLNYDELFKNGYPQRPDIISRYAQDLPVASVRKADWEVYDVYVSFGGNNISENGYYDFRFTIDNKTGKWLVNNGLQWTTMDDYRITTEVPL